MTHAHAQQIKRNLFLGLILLVGLGLLAPNAPARDQAGYATYLGTRLRLYGEAYRLLDKIIASGSAKEISRARQAKATVKKDEGDYLFRINEDESTRTRLYEEAVEVFGDPEDTAGITAKANLRLDLAQVFMRSNPPKARNYCDQAIKALKDEVARLEKMRNPAQAAQFKLLHADYSRCFYAWCYGYYVRALTHEKGSAERSEWVKKSKYWIDELQFGLEETTPEMFRAYMLQGDLEMALGQPDKAVSQYLDVVAFLEDFPRNEDIGYYALNWGYLRAAEVLTSDLDYEPSSLKKCMEIYAEAYSRYGHLPELAFDFKRFGLFKISAMIKLGDPNTMKPAIKELFVFADDRDVSFRRQALSVLVSIAAREGMETEQRFACATKVYKQRDSVHLSILLKLISAHQGILATCGKPQDFETYAPACYNRIGRLYSEMWRFLDATLVYREACYRTLYFRAKFKQSVPGHMLGRCERITDAKSASKFPIKMAEQFSRNVRLLTSPLYGDDKNPEFARLLREAEDLKAEIGEEAAQWDLAFNRAVKRYKEDKLPQAAVRYLGLHPRYKKYHIAVYYGARAYQRISDSKRSQRVAKSGEREEQESDKLFLQWRESHAKEFSGLPTSLWQGVENEHFDVFMDRNTDGHLANWHKAAYFFKKYFLVEIQRAWVDVEPLLKEVKNPDVLDGLFALCEAKNEKWLRIPIAKRQPDGDMKRLAFAVYTYCFLLRNPNPLIGSKEVKALKEKHRVDALRGLRRFMDLFGGHIQATDDSEAEIKKAKLWQHGVLRLAFGALSEAKDGESSEEVYLEFKKLFPEMQEDLNRMVRAIYRIYRETLQPRERAFSVSSAHLKSLFNMMKKHLFDRIEAAKYKEAAAALEKAKTRPEKYGIVADHFWKVWVVEKLLDNPDLPNIAEFVSPSLRPALEKRWKELAASFPEQWGKAVRAQFDAELKRKAYDSVRKELSALAAKAGNQGLLDALKESATKLKDDDKVDLYTQIRQQIELSTAQLRYFLGTTFVYEFGEFLQEQALELDATARPLTAKVLTYYRLYQATKGVEGAVDILTQATLGRQYFRIRDWERTIEMLQPVLDANQKSYGKETSIAVAKRTRLAGKSRSGEELELKHQLGRAYFERYKEDGDVEDLKRAALLMRRVYCFNRLRDANEILAKQGGKKYKLSFQKKLETYYLDTVEYLAEIYLELYRNGKVKIKWPEYKNQFTMDLMPDKKQKLQEVPDSKAAFLWHARLIRQMVWSSYSQLDDHPYRTEYRENLAEWVRLTTVWLDVHGNEVMDVSMLKRMTVKKMVQDTIDIARAKGVIREVLPDKRTVAFKERLDKLLERLLASVKKSKVDAK